MYVIVNRILVSKVNGSTPREKNAPQGYSPPLRMPNDRLLEREKNSLLMLLSFLIKVTEVLKIYWLNLIFFPSRSHFPYVFNLSLPEPLDRVAFRGYGQPPIFFAFSHWKTSFNSPSNSNSFRVGETVPDSSYLALLTGSSLSESLD